MVYLVIISAIGHVVIVRFGGTPWEHGHIKMVLLDFFPIGFCQ
jgi:hypothetical protein